MKYSALLAVMLLISTLSGCAASLVYDPDRSRKQQDCYKIQDRHERQRCLESAAMSYDEFPGKPARGRSGWPFAAVTMTQTRPLPG